MTRYLERIAGVWDAIAAAERRRHGRLLPRHLPRPRRRQRARDRRRGRPQDHRPDRPGALQRQPRRLRLRRRPARQLRRRPDRPRPARRGGPRRRRAGRLRDARRRRRARAPTSPGCASGSERRLPNAEADGDQLSSSCSRPSPPRDRLRSRHGHGCRRRACIARNISATRSRPRPGEPRDSFAWCSTMPSVPRADLTSGGPTESFGGHATEPRVSPASDVIGRRCPSGGWSTVWCMAFLHGSGRTCLLPSSTARTRPAAYLPGIRYPSQGSCR